MDMIDAPDSKLTEAIRIRETARQLVSSAQVRAALDRMAVAAADVVAQENPLVLAVMNGGAFTAMELCQRWDFPHELDFVHVTRYDGDLVGGELSWRAWPDRDLSGRSVIVVDDIVDHGETMAAICERLRCGGARRVYTAVLVIKRLENPRARVDVDSTLPVRAAIIREPPRARGRGFYVTRTRRHHQRTPARAWTWTFPGWRWRTSTYSAAGWITRDTGGASPESGP